MKQQHTLQPKLRFPEFEGDWIETKLKEITSLITKGTTPKSFYTQGINFVKLESLDGFNIDKRKFVYIDSETHNNELKRSKLKVNDILFAIAGATVGKVAYVKQDILPANTNQALAIIRLKENVNHNYILQILSSRQMKNYIYMNMSVGAQPNISLEQLNNFCYKSPSLPEQQKIADYLSTVDNKINLLEEKKAKLALYKKAMMQKLFAQEIRFKPTQCHTEPVEVEPVEVELMETYPEWEEKRLGEVLNVGNKIRVNNTKNYNKITIKLHLKGIEFSNINKEMADTRPFYVRELNEIIVGKQNYFNGSIAIVNEEFAGGICSNAIMSFSVKNDNVKFIYSFLSQSDYMKKREHLANGTGQKELSENDFLNFLIQMPSLPEQQKIADFLSAIDESIEKVTEQINQMQSFKKAMLQQMFV